MNLDQIEDIKELKALKAKIEKKLKKQKLAPAKPKLSALYPQIKDDHKKHIRPDGRKVFRSVVDYLECYVKGLPPVTKSEFNKRFGIQSSRGKVTPEIVQTAKNLFSQGKSLAEVAQEVGLSIASCQKIKSGSFDN
jgi:hypothetical protein